MMTVVATTTAVTTAMDCKGNGVGGNYDSNSISGDSNGGNSDDDNCSGGDSKGGRHIQQSLKVTSEETAVVVAVMAATMAMETTINYKLKRRQR